MSASVAGSFTATTVKAKLFVAVPLSASVAVSVIVVLPLAFADGVMVTVRFAPLPVNAMLEFATRLVLDETPVNVRFPAVVSTSPTVKRIAPVAVSSLVV